MNTLIQEFYFTVDEVDKAIGTNVDYSHYQGIIYDFAAFLFIQIALWLISVVVGKCWPVDFIWSNWPGIQAMFILERSPLRVS
jgi:steroid 5-alpha reductase family enzyme